MVFMKTIKALSIGDVIRQLRKKQKLTQSQLADQIEGYDAANLSRFETGRQSITQDKLSQIGRVFGYELSELYSFAESGDKDFLNSYSDIKKSEDLLPIKKIPLNNSVPLISWVQAGSWAEANTICDTERFDDWIDIAIETGSDAFALKVVGNSMLNPTGSPSIPEDSIIIVDPETEAENGKIVVAMLKSTSEATLKKLVIDGPNKYLMPLNPDYKPISINGDCLIIGVVRQVIYTL
jgi:SOS-response transcriptional repressor LexA